MLLHHSFPNVVRFAKQSLSPAALGCGLLSSLLLVSPASAGASSNVLFLLDGSNSMWGEVDGTPKIETAKSALTNMLSDLQAETQAGLVAYGHTKEKDCNDVQLLAPVGTQPAAIQDTLSSVTPTGKTPITAAMTKAAEAFPAGDTNNYMVLISDGKETCGGDPCQEAAALRQQGVQVKIHVVGFDVVGEEREQLKCIARAGGGQYFNADSTSGFTRAVAAVTEQVVQASPEPVAAVAPETPATPPAATDPTQDFQDDFAGEELAEAWEVLNPNPDSYIVEDGSLLGISSTKGSLAEGDVENLFRLTNPLPTGDWVVTAKVSIGFATGFENFSLGVYQDKDNWIATQAYTYTDHRGSHIGVSGEKRANQKRTYSATKMLPMRSSWETVTAHSDRPLYLRLEKKGRSYYFSAMFEPLEGEEETWFTTDKVSSLRQKGDLVVGFNQHSSGNGVNADSETTWTLDWVKVEAK